VKREENWQIYYLIMIKINITANIFLKKSYGVFEKSLFYF